MRLLGNICWFILGGFISGMAWVLWCITIVGTPFGKQFFKIAKLALRPFSSVFQYLDRPCGRDHDEDGIVNDHE